ncbi:TraM-binding TraD/TraG-like protein [Actinomadura pelletieri DSM 43383]|uniref:TraM-binding TraD/TraG-like protein n=1 Tax=Actinomadura pelletieri DSM 43383 TaxID=1120940 RepID=A0A495QG09_9ACTN|nr:type IV secretion system DNA-binding domain-containing protein [Actinomadura pelletieri]RKS70693.1 TraM-binding TraD/TraG-like protein [Actinomadura pelletieri DSM 43383]
MSSTPLSLVRLRPSQNACQSRSPRPSPTEPPGAPFLRDPDAFIHSLIHRAEDFVGSYGWLCGALLVCAVTAFLTVRHWRWRRRHDRLAEGARQITVLPPPEVDPDAAHELWANLLGLLRPAYKRLLTGQPHLAWEYAWDTAAVQIRLWVPGTVPLGFIERAIEAAWPAARTETAPASASPLPTGAVAVGGRLRMARPDWLPLRADHRADPLRALVGAASGLSPGQRAIVQICARPATGRRLAKAHHAAAALRGSTASQRPWGWLFDLITPSAAARRPTTSAYMAHPERAAEVRAILDKAREPQWEMTISYALAISPDTVPVTTLDTAAKSSSTTSSSDGTVTPRQGDRAVRRELRRGLRGRAHAIASAYALYAGHNYLRRHRLWHPETMLARRWMRRGDLCSVTELAALAHLPWDSAVPGLSRAGSKAVPPPPGIATPGPDAKQLGVSDAGIVRPVALGVAEARHHMHVLGATGSGKSTLMTHMILADAQAGRGAVVIDPKGDLIVDLLARLPEHAADKVVLFDPDQRRRPALNVLQGPDAHLASDNLVGIFHRIYKDFWGPRTDDILRSACLTLWHAPDATLADIPRLLADPAYRAPYTARVRDPILADFWAWYDDLSPGARAHATGPVLNKLRAFLLRDFIRSTLGSGTSTFDPTTVLDGGLLLIRAPKGILGADACAVFGSLMLAKIWETVSNRTRHGQSARADSALYVDECHNFLTLPHGLADLLAEARAYRLSVVLAHQDLAQLSRELREAISANARNKVFFAVSPEDARTLERHMAPNLSQHDLAHLDAFQAGTRLIVNAAETSAFTLRTRPLPPAVPGRAKLIRRVSAETYGARPQQRPHRARADDPRADPRAEPPPAPDVTSI